MITVEIKIIYLVILAIVPALLVFMTMYKSLLIRDKEYKKVVNDNLEINNALLEAEAELVQLKNKQHRSTSSDKLMAVKSA
jgi:hypothetical protein